MYPNIKPTINLEETISHPIHPEKVVGFRGRNTRLGRTAIIVKTDATEGERAYIPTKAMDGLTSGDGEFVVLDDEKMLAMNGTDFVSEYQYHTIEDDGQQATMGYIETDNSQFRAWDHYDVGVKE